MATFSRHFLLCVHTAFIISPDHTAHSVRLSKGGQKNTEGAKNQTKQRSQVSVTCFVVPRPGPRL